MAMFCLFTLSACELSSDPEVMRAAKITSQTPVDLRSFATADLRAVVSVGNFAATLLGSDVVDNEWSIVLDGDLSENETYSVNVKWYVFDSLVFEEVGSIFTDPTVPSLTISLDYFLNVGPVRFDDDCDGISNSDELINGSDHTSPGSVVDETCSNLVAQPEDMNQFDWVDTWVDIWREYDEFQTMGFTSQVQSFHQALRVGKIEVDEAINVQTFLIGNFVETANYIEAKLSLYQLDDGSRGVEVSFKSDNQIADVQPAHTNCYRVDESFLVLCSLDVQWDIHQWYSLEINRTPEEAWEAWFVNETTNQRTKIGTVQTSQTIQWIDTEFDLTYATRKTYSECVDGVDPVSVQHKHAVLNGDFELKGGEVKPGLCLKIGGGWGAGNRELNNETQFNMSIGRL